MGLFDLVWSHLLPPTGASTTASRCTDVKPGGRQDRQRYVGGESHCCVHACRVFRTQGRDGSIRQAQGRVLWGSVFPIISVGRHGSCSLAHMGCPTRPLSGALSRRAFRRRVPFHRGWGSTMTARGIPLTRRAVGSLPGPCLRTAGGRGGGLARDRDSCRAISRQSVPYDAGTDNFSCCSCTHNTRIHGWSKLLDHHGYVGSVG